MCDEGAEEGLTLEQVEDELYRRLDSLRGVRGKEDEWMNEYLRNQKNASTVYPKFQAHLSYYQEFWKIYLVNEMMIIKIKEVSADNKLIREQLGDLEELEATHARLSALRYKKKQRRPNSEISKNFYCPYSPCDRVYGCDVALNLHIKIKHNGGNKTERDKLAKEIIEAELEGCPPPKVYLNFPPGYVDKFRESLRREKK